MTYPNKNKMYIYSNFPQISIEHPLGVRCYTNLNGGKKMCLSGDLKWEGGVKLTNICEIVTFFIITKIIFNDYFQSDLELQNWLKDSKYLCTALI